MGRHPAERFRRIRHESHSVRTPSARCWPNSLLRESVGGDWDQASAFSTQRRPALRDASVISVATFRILTINREFPSRYLSIVESVLAHGLAECQRNDHLEDPDEAQRAILGGKSARNRTGFHILSYFGKSSPALNPDLRNRSPVG